MISIFKGSKEFVERRMTSQNISVILVNRRLITVKKKRPTIWEKNKGVN